MLNFSVTTGLKKHFDVLAGMNFFSVWFKSFKETVLKTVHFILTCFLL